MIKIHERQWLRRNLISVISVAVSLVAIAFGYYWYTQSTKERIPRFVIEPARSEILRADRVADAPIRILKKSDNSEITRDVTSITFYFWNAGSEPIKKQHVHIPITISIDDSTAEILDYQVIKISHPVSQFALIPHLTDGDSISNHIRTLRITFDILEKEQGAVCQILYSGNREAKISINGYIEGFGDLISSKTSMSSRSYEIWQVAIFFISVVIVLVALRISNNLLKYILRIVTRRWLRRLIAFADVLLMIGFIYLLIFVLQSRLRDSNARFNVPSSLLSVEEMQVD